VAADIYETSPETMYTHEKGNEQDSSATNKLCVGKQAQEKNGPYVRMNFIEFILSLTC
jgi:hypothetical protein